MTRALFALLFLATLAHASPRHDQFTLGVTGGAMFPADAAYDPSAAPELGLVVGYNPEWTNFRLDLSGFFTGGRSAERGVSVLANWLVSDAPTTFFAGGGIGLEWIGVNYAIESAPGWHFLSYPEDKPHAPFLAGQLGVEFARDTAHPWMLGAEVHLPFDYLAWDVRFPSVLGTVKVAF